MSNQPQGKKPMISTSVLLPKVLIGVGIGVGVGVTEALQLLGLQP